MINFAKSKEDIFKNFIELPIGITAMPELFEALDIEEDIITINAMETQTDIAEKIVQKNANYILTVKGNQSQLLEEIQDEFRFWKQI